MKPYLCNLLAKGMLPNLIWKLSMSPFKWCMVAWSAPRSDWVRDQNEEGSLQTPEVLSVQSSKQNNPVLMWKLEFPRLSACHLAVCWSWVGYHTSFERGDSGLPADIKIRTVIQLIGILWSYFEHFWGLPMQLNTLACHSVAPWRLTSYYTPDKRGDIWLSNEV